MDTGAGSADTAVLQLKGKNPTQLREIALPENAQTKWCGGRFINQKIVSLIIRDLPNVAVVLVGAKMTQAQLEEALEKAFEEKKPRFNGSQPLTLLVNNLPAVPGTRLSVAGRVLLSVNDIKSAFDASLKLQFEMLDAAIRKATVNRIGRGREKRRQVTTILLMGGSAQSPYIQSEIRARYSVDDPKRGRYYIPVQCTRQESGTSTIIAKGGVELCNDRDLINEREIRRGYCIIQNTELKAGKHYPKDSTYRAISDGQWYAKDRSRFITKPGQTIPTNHVAPAVTGVRDLCLSEMDEDGSGWTVEEVLCYTDDEKVKEDTWIDDPKSNIRRMPGVLRFKIPLEHQQYFGEPIKCPHRDDKYFRIQYEVRVHFIGEFMTYELVIPMTGAFVEGGSEDNESREVQTISCAGVFKFNSMK